MNENTWFRTAVYLLSAVLVASIAAVILAWVIADPSQEVTMGLELFKSALQLGVVAVIGGGITALYKWIEKSVEAARDLTAKREQQARDVAAKREQQAREDAVRQEQRAHEDATLPEQRFHDLRHLTAALLLSEGADIFTVKTILGHSQISQTANTYGHLTEKLSVDAASRLHRALLDDSLTTKLTSDPDASNVTGNGPDGY